MANSATKNTAIMTIASVAQKVFAFVYFTLVARMIGVEGTGKYFLALSFTTIFVVFVDLGFTNVLIREAAKYKEKAQQFFSNVLLVKFFFGAASYAAVIIAVWLLGYDADIRQLVYVSGITMLFDSLHLTLYGVLRAHNNLKYEARGVIGTQFGTLILGSIFLFTGQPLIMLMVAFLIPSMCNAAYAALMLKRHYGITVLPKYDKAVLKKFTKIAIPFALAAIFARVYSYADTVLLSKLMDETAVGLYSIPYKVTYAFQFIPLAFVAALYPKFAEQFVHDKKQLAKTFEKSIMYLLLISLPIAFGIGVLAEDIVLTVFSTQYAASVIPQKILIAGLVFSYVSFPIGAFLNACNKQVHQTVIVACILVINVVANFLLIPVYGVSGAAIAALIGNIVLMLAGYFLVPKVVKIAHSEILVRGIKLLLSAIVMGVVAWMVNAQMHFVFAIAAGAITYPLLVLLTKALTIQEVREAYLTLKR